MFAFDDKKQPTNQVVKYTVIAMFLLSTAHIVSTFTLTAFFPPASY